MLEESCVNELVCLKSDDVDGEFLNDDTDVLELWESSPGWLFV